MQVEQARRQDARDDIGKLCGLEDWQEFLASQLENVAMLAAESGVSCGMACMDIEQVVWCDVALGLE
jgi:hypothetical protein